MTGVQTCALPILTKSLISTLIAYAKAHTIELVGGAAGFPEYVNLNGLLTSHDNIDWRIQPKKDFPEMKKGFPEMKNGKQEIENGKQEMKKG